MPLPEYARTPPFNIVRVSHLEWGMTDLGYAREFYVDLIGFHLEDDTGDTLYLRGREELNHHSLVLVKSDDTSVRRIGYKVAYEDDLDRAEAYFAAQGLPTAWVQKHAQGRTLHTTDPFGVPLEFYATMEHRESLLQQYTQYRGSHVQRIDHINLFHHDVNAGTRFYVSELGFRITEVTVADINDDDSDIWGIWLHRKGGVHDIAFTNGLGPRLHHVGVWVPSVNDIIHFCDVLSTSGHIDAFERGPGRHGISNAFFLYIRDRDGHRIELFTSDYLTVDPDHPVRFWDLRDPQRQTLWGQPAPRSWFELGSAFTGLEPQPATLTAQPIVALD